MLDFLHKSDIIVSNSDVRVFRTQNIDNFNKQPTSLTGGQGETIK